MTSSEILLKNCVYVFCIFYCIKKTWTVFSPYFALVNLTPSRRVWVGGSRSKERDRNSELVLRSTYHIFEWDRLGSKFLNRSQICSHTPSALNAGAKRSDVPYGHASMLLLGEVSEATEPYNKYDKIRPHSIRSLQFDRKVRPLSFRPEKFDLFTATRRVSLLEADTAPPGAESVPHQPFRPSL